MKDTLKPGIKYQCKFTVTDSQTVPAMYPESGEAAARPEVFATGFLVGFLELACVRAIIPHLDWPEEQAVGTFISVTHEAATPVGMEVTANVELIGVEGRKLIFQVEAHDEVDLISRGRHERMIVNKRQFEGRARSKFVQD
ncbi:thioesterase [Polynucleobacter wuianus]|jgi:fluoroacetyl-CoA thioesterase|uniref:Thioesterase n=1 Tax=Polynucleobacter wuianus TaxID=1743168 RepID=A0A191UGV3_9BURK|nr:MULTISPECIES: thioesterase family protein [Polynucleobacter]ANJ00208.1 thioesterase [Polynucleobacter wuianus]MBU3553829.1 thioesterase family protein [Polynucleobacter sp. MWH-Post4-6-1]